MDKEVNLGWLNNYPNTVEFLNGKYVPPHVLRYELKEVVKEFSNLRKKKTKKCKS